jgi:hypothetical protein
MHPSPRRRLRAGTARFPPASPCHGPALRAVRGRFGGVRRRAAAPRDHRRPSHESDPIRAMIGSPRSQTRLTGVPPRSHLADAATRRSVCAPRSRRSLVPHAPTKWRFHRYSGGALSLVLGQRMTNRPVERPGGAGRAVAGRRTRQREQGRTRVGAWSISIHGGVTSCARHAISSIEPEPPPAARGSG